MNIKRMYLDLSIKYKILLFAYTLIVLVSLILGFYSYLASEKYIISKVSSSNMEVLKQLNSSISFLSKDVNDISLYLCLDPGVQTFLTQKPEEKGSASMKDITENDIYPINNSLKFIMNIIASKGYISSIMIYNENGFPPYTASTDRGGILSDFAKVRESPMYKEAKALEGSPIWGYLPVGDNSIIQNNVSPKIVMYRIVKNFDYDLGEIGFMAMAINESSIQSLYPSTLKANKEGIVIIDSKGNVISQGGQNFYTPGAADQKYISEVFANRRGYLIDCVSDVDMLINYDSIDRTDWKIIYMVPMVNMVKEINSIKVMTVVIILACLLFSFPLTLVISSYLTAPIKLLLASMKRFQEGNFNERVNFKYGDEIGMLGAGYDSMVANIKDLIDKAYILQIKEREAELNALQAQINPHFLYNTLDTIFWKAQRHGDKEISEMVFSLSKLFRLSLNRGKGLTLVSREKELIEHYLLLQKIRYKDNLNYDISIADDILNLVIPKLILQPFIENSLRHGIERKEDGGTIKVRGSLEGERIHFMVEDDGVGMSHETIQCLMEKQEDKIMNESYVSGGYAIKNVDERLKLNYGKDYTLKFISEVGKGTTVELILPVLKGETFKEETR